MNDQSFSLNSPYNPLESPASLNVSLHHNQTLSSKRRQPRKILAKNIQKYTLEDEIAKYVKQLKQKKLDIKAKYQKNFETKEYLRQ